MIQDPGFESGIGPWSTFGGTLATSSLQAHTGSFSALMTNRTATFMGPVQDVTASVTPGDDLFGTCVGAARVGGPAAGGLHREGHVRGHR